MTDTKYKALFNHIETIVENDERLSSFDRTRGDWIGWDLPPEAAVGPLPCIRLTGVGSTNSKAGNEYTGVLSIYTQPGETTALVELADALLDGMNSAIMIHASGWASREENNFGRAVYPIRFYL